MQIKSMKIKNYRNLDGLEIVFNNETNYIVGDNNIGKSNLLKLFEKLFNTAFKEEDYLKRNKKMVIELKIALSDEENLLYKLPLDDGNARIIITQGIYESIPLVLIDNKKLDYKILKSVIFKELSNNARYSNDSINRNRVEELLNNDFSNMRLMLSRTNPLGQQLYLTMASLLIYKVIFDEAMNGFLPLEKLIYEKDGKKHLPLIIAIDEPELHLNPYLQRTLINYYKKLLTNKDEVFCRIIKEDFNIDYLDSTLLVVTHSTEALVDDYKSIIRLYRRKGINGVSCGASLNLNPNIAKHLSMMFSDIKNAFFCKSAIIVEGITEYGAFTKFAETIKAPLDNYGICLLNGQGEGSVTKIRSLLSAFKIDSYAMYDADVKSKKTQRSRDFFTDEVCFEMEIVSTLVNSKNFDLLEQIAYMIPGAKSQIFDENYCKKSFEKIGFSYSFTRPYHLKDISRDDLDLYKATYFTWFYRKKGLYLGRIIGQALPRELIPECYRRVIAAATDEAIKNHNSEF